MPSGMFRNPHTSVARPFVIRRLDTAEYKLNRQIPASVSKSDCFLYLYGGEVLTDVGAEPFLVCSGQFLYIPEGIPFAIKYYNGSKGYMGAFSRPMLRNPNIGLLYRREPVLADVPEEERGFVSSLSEKLLREQDEGGGETVSVILQAVLDLLLAQIDAFAGDGRAKLGSTLCTGFLDMVFDRSSAISGVSAYAGRLGVSANHLNRTVKGATGRSAGEWVDISRIALSKLLLRQSDMPIIDIAIRSGFEDQSYFSRFFKKHTGLTPSQFRSGEE